MILIIGIGNPLRQDDGAGWALAHRLADLLREMGLPCRVLCVQQLAPESAVDVAAAEVTAVCFVDVAVNAPGLRLIALDALDDSAEHAQITHQIGPGTVLAYAGILRSDVPTAWLLTVGGIAFDHGEGLSDPVQAAIADDVTLMAIARQIAEIHVVGSRAPTRLAPLE